MGRTRRHHFVPACYLWHWATRPERNGRLCVFDRTTGTIRPSTPENEAHQRDFYAIEADNVDANIVEDEALTKLEGIFAPAIARVNAVSALPSNIRPLAAFIAVQAVRTPEAGSAPDTARC